jgi:hypothetical protein
MAQLIDAIILYRRDAAVGWRNYVVQTWWRSWLTQLYCTDVMAQLVDAIILYTHNGAVSWRNALQAGIVRFHFPIMSLDFFIDINPSGLTMNLGSIKPLTEMSSRNISWGVNATVCLGLKNLPPSCTGRPELWEPPLSGTLGVCPTLYRDWFTFAVCCKYLILLWSYIIWHRPQTKPLEPWMYSSIPWFILIGIYRRNCMIW